MTINDASNPSLADALEALDKASLSQIQKRDTRSAVVTFCKALGLSPADVPANMAYARRKLEGMSHTALGFSKGRWSNIKTGVARAIGLVGKTYPSRNTAPLLPEWQDLLDAIPKSLIRKLSAGARECQCFVQARDPELYVQRRCRGRPAAIRRRLPEAPRQPPRQRAARAQRE
jgi:hypothetical protein